MRSDKHKDTHTQNSSVVRAGTPQQQSQQIVMLHLLQALDENPGGAVLHIAPIREAVHPQPLRAFFRCTC